MYRLFYTMIGIIVVLFQLSLFLYLQDIYEDVMISLIILGGLIILITSSNFRRFCPTPPTQEKLRLTATAAFATAVSYSTSIILVTMGIGNLEHMVKICVIGIFIPIICIFFKLGDSKWVSFFYLFLEKNFIFFIFSYNTLNYS